MKIRNSFTPYEIALLSLVFEYQERIAALEKENLVLSVLGLKVAI